MRKFYLYAKRLGSVLTVVLLLLQIPGAGVTFWNEIPQVIGLWL